MTKVLVLTALTCPGGFPRQIYHRFAGSLVQTGFPGNIVFMVTDSNYRERSLAELEKQYPGVRFHLIPELDEYKDINCYRYRYYYDYLVSIDNEFDYVMLSDSRDVYFQRDISRYPFDAEIDLFLAEEEKLIGDCGINSGWIADLFGNPVLEELKQQPVLCSGTTIGKVTAIKDYLTLMTRHVTRVEDEFHCRFGNLGGIDQGIHNYIYYRNQLADLSIRTMHNTDNLFYTIGHVASDDKDRRFLNDESQFINSNGELCYCIHQFDRLDQAILRQSGIAKW